jgi:hypothetical protein
VRHQCKRKTEEEPWRRTSPVEQMDLCPMKNGCNGNCLFAWFESKRTSYKVPVGKFPVRMEKFKMGELEICKLCLFCVFAEFADFAVAVVEIGQDQT